MAPEMVRGWSRGLGPGNRLCPLAIPASSTWGRTWPRSRGGEGQGGGQMHPWTGSQVSQGPQFADNERESYLNAPGAQGPLPQARDPPPRTAPGTGPPSTDILPTCPLPS